MPTAIAGVIITEPQRGKKGSLCERVRNGKQNQNVHNFGLRAPYQVLSSFLEVTF